MVDDLAAEEAVLGSDVALDVDEVRDPIGVAVGEEKCGQASHGVTDEVEAIDTVCLQDQFRGPNQKRDRQGVVVGDCGAAASRRVVQDDGSVV